MITKEELINLFNIKESKRMDVYVDWITANAIKSKVNERPNAEEDMQKAKLVYRLEITNEGLRKLSELLGKDKIWVEVKEMARVIKDAYGLPEKIVLVEGDKKRVFPSTSIYDIWPTHRSTPQIWYIATNFDNYDLTQEEINMTKEIYTVNLNENSSFSDKCLYVTMKDIIKENKITNVSFNEETEELEITYKKVSKITPKITRENIAKFAEVNRILSDEDMFDSYDDSITDYNEDPITEKQKRKVKSIYFDDYECGHTADPDEDYNLVEVFLEEGIGLNTKALVEYYRELQNI